MSILKNECTICTENFKNSDEIYTTSCGHIFHYVCMTQWQRNGSTCPQCRTYNPTTHKIYLTFEERNEENPEKIEELELKLISSNEKNVELNDQMNEAEIHFLQLQEQFTFTERENKDLKEKISQMNDSENNFLHLQGQYTESSEFIKCLEDQIKELTLKNEISEISSERLRYFEDKIQELLIENERQKNELRLKCLEMESLKTGLDAGQSTLTDSILSGKIRILEQKLKHISSEFEKEINVSTKLSIENLKLKSKIDQIKSVENVKRIAPKQTNKKSNLVENPVNKYKGNIIKTSNQIKNNSSTKIFIKDMPSNQITESLENVVVNLALKMNFTISIDDVVQVKLADNNKKMSSKVHFMAEFKNAQQKNKFMEYKNILKNYPSTSSIIIREYMEDEFHSLLIYAKEKLRNNGYNYVFYKNNQIFAKKHRAHPQAIPIHNKAQVDSLLNSKQSLELETKD